jgi:CCR4-NOT transcription complex subunit 1
LCQALLRISHLAEARPDLIANINRAIASSGEGSLGSTDPSNLATIPVADTLPVFSAIQPDRIEGDLELPPEELSDKILFVVNNLAPSHFDSKLSEMWEQFLDEYSRWFANHLADQWISTEPNNHRLYLRFVDALDRRILLKFMIQEMLVESAAMLVSLVRLHYLS